MVGAAAGRSRRADPAPLAGSNGGQAGYRIVFLHGRPGTRTAYVHRLVLEAFRGAAPNGHECRHLNGDTADNRLSNLQWGTPQENAADRARHGTEQRGSQKPNAKLTPDDVRDIRLLSAGWPSTVLASWFGVSPTTVCCILKRRIWKHV